MAESAGELLLRLQEQEAFSKALLTRMATEAKSGQFLQSKLLLEQYSSINPLYTNSRGGRFLQSCITALNLGQRDVFEAQVRRHSSITLVPEWQTDLLRAIMASLP
jgi:hypothetical protein